MGTCIVKEGCTTECLFTGKRCTRYGVPLRSLLQVEHWFGRVRGMKALWKAREGVWVEVASSRSARVLADAFTGGRHVVMPKGVDPNGRVDAWSTEVAPAGALF